MPDQIADYARQAAEAFLAAGRTADAAEALRLRRKGYELVDLIKQAEAASPKPADQR